MSGLVLNLDEVNLKVTKSYCKFILVNEFFFHFSSREQSVSTENVEHRALSYKCYKNVFYRIFFSEWWEDLGTSLVELYTITDSPLVKIEAQMGITKLYIIYVLITAAH